MNLWKNIFSLIIGNGTSEVINFIFLLVIVRFYNQLDYAVYKQGYLIITTFLPFLMLGLPISLSYYMPKTDDPREQNRYILNVAATLAILGSFGSLIVVIFGTNIAHAFNNPKLVPYMGYFAGVILAETVFSFYPYCMVSLNRARELATITALFAIIRIFSLLVCVLMDASIGIFLGFLFANSLLKLIFIVHFVIRRLMQYGVRIRRHVLIEQILFAVPLGLFTIVYSVMTVLDKNLTSIFYSPEQYTIYVNGVFNLPFVGVLTGSISSALLPKLSSTFDQNDQSSLNQSVHTWHQTTLVASFLLIPLMFVLMTFADEAVTLLFTETYIASTPIFRIYMLVLLTKVTHFGTLLTVANKQRHLLYASMIAIGVLTAGFGIVHTVAGFDQIVWAVVAANYALALVMLWQIKRIFNQTVREVFPWGPTIVMISISLFFLLVFSWIKYQVVLAPIYEFIILGGTMYAVTLTFCVFFVPDARSLANIIVHERIMVRLRS